LQHHDARVRKPERMAGTVRSDHRGFKEIIKWFQHHKWGRHIQQNPSFCLVGGFNPSEKYESQWEGLFNILWKNKTCSKPPTSCGTHILVHAHI